MIKFINKTELLHINASKIQRLKQSSTDDSVKNFEYLMNVWRWAMGDGEPAMGYTGDGVGPRQIADIKTINLDFWSVLRLKRSFLPLKLMV